MRLSVIIPTLNEVASLEATLASIPVTHEVEVLVADGGSTDGTDTLARRRHRCIGSLPGRGRQMNAAAAEASFDVLVFLHADSRLPRHAFDAIEAALQCDAIVGGAFHLQVDSPHPGLRLVNWAVNLRSTFLGMPYGDQAIFVRREVFRRVKGYADLPIMEDVDLVQRMRAEGRITILDLAVTTSGRRWVANGVLRTTAMNWMAMLLYVWGIRAGCIRRLYDRVLERG